MSKDTGNLRLEDWSIICDTHPPEIHDQFLQGRVFGHRYLPNNSLMTTSAIKKVEGNKVTTSNDCVYVLGKPCARYVQWCETNNVHIPTREEPIRWGKESLISSILKPNVRVMQSAVH